MQEPECEVSLPRTEVEELVAQAWREVLSVENLSIYDNFFELGGHSLLATQIIARLRGTFDREIPLAALFDAPTVADLSIEVEKLLRDGDAPTLPPIVPVPRDGRPIPLSMNQEHLWRLDQMMPGTHFFNMPYVYHLNGELNVEALERSLNEIVRRHEALRTVFAEVDGCPVQIIKDCFTFQIPMEDLRGWTLDELSQQAAVLLLEVREQPFDLATGPLFRIKLLRLTDRESFLLVTMHHIISDHWSMQVFRRELVGIYEAYSQGRPSPFSRLPSQFADHAGWEVEMLKRGLLDSQLKYWKKQLSGPLSELKFNQTAARHKELDFRTFRQAIELDETLSRGIKAAAHRETCTPFMVMLAVLNLVVYTLTGQDDVRIGTLLANRRRQSESAIGHFLNTVVLRVRLSPNLDFGRLLHQVREITLAAHANQELPCAELVRVLETDEKINRDSLFQVLLNYQAVDSRYVDLPNLTFASLDWQPPVTDSDAMLTACDLIVTIKETTTQFKGNICCKSNIFENEAVVCIVERFIAVLKQVALTYTGAIA